MQQNDIVHSVTPQDSSQLCCLPQDWPLQSCHMLHYPLQPLVAGEWVSRPASRHLQNNSISVQTTSACREPSQGCQTGSSLSSILRGLQSPEQTISSLMYLLLLSGPFLNGSISSDTCIFYPVQGALSRARHLCHARFVQNGAVWCDLPWWNFCLGQWDFSNPFDIFHQQTSDYKVLYTNCIQASYKKNAKCSL